MFRSLSICCVLVLYLLSTLRAVLPIIHYALDKDFYAVRCVNVDKPELECEGCCQVVKEVQKTTEQEQSPQSAPSTSDRQTSSETPHLLGSCQHLPLPQEFSSQTAYASRTFALAEGFFRLPFQPPRV